MEMAIIMLNFKKLVHFGCSFVTLCNLLDTLCRRSKAAILLEVGEGIQVKTSFKGIYKCI